MNRSVNKWTHERLINWFRKNHPEWVIKVSKIPVKLTCKTKIEFQCSICDYINTKTIHHIVNRRQGCVRCNNIEKWNVIRLKQWFLDNRPQWTLNVDYLPNKITRNSKIEYKCEICGYINFQSIDKISQGSGCLRCINREPWSIERLKLWFKTNKPGDTLISRSIREPLYAKHKIEYICGVCGTQNHQVIDKLVNEGCGCPVCKKSKGEVAVTNILNKLMINFKSQYPSKNIVSNSKYRYDFAIPQYKIVLEYHGVQHYEPQTFGCKSRTAKEMHDNVCRNDKIKKGIAENAGWVYLEIPYTLIDNPTKIEHMIIESIYYNNF